ncbi:MAG: NADH:flavin oxidoreductase [Planctomycetota bacterium]
MPTKHELRETRWPSAEEARASRLFSPAHLGPLETRTRTWVPAMVPWRATDDGEVTPEVLDWYGRFADGQPGVIVIEATGIRDVPSGPLLRIGHDRFLPGLRELVEVVRERSEGRTRLLVQCIDFLAIKRRPEKEKFLQRFLAIDDHHREGLGQIEGHADAAAGDEQAVRDALIALPHEVLLGLLRPREVEDLEHGYRERVDDLHLPHVRDLPQTLPGLFADAAARAREAGFDGVELHFAHAYTMASFLSAKNRRDDGYGTTREGRVRLPLEVIAAVRERVGGDYCVGTRFLGREVIDGGSDVADACWFAAEFARAGLDFLSVSVGGKFDDAKQPRVGHAAYPYTGPSGHECMPTVRIDGQGAFGEVGPFGRNLGIVRSIRQAVREAGSEVPIVGAGGVDGFELAERALERGDCDLVAAARQSLADPDWWRKVELGHGDEVRRCVFTNYCEALDQRHQQVTCQLWDRELEAPDPRSDTVRRSSDGKRRLVPAPWTPKPPAT